MANEITYSGSLTASKGGVDISASYSKTIDMTNDDMADKTQIIGTATEALDLGDVTVPKLMVIKNLDTTNFVDIGINTPLTQIFAHLLPGEFCIFPCAPGVTYYALADTASCRVALALCES